MLYSGSRDKACSRIQSIFSTKKWNIDNYHYDNYDFHHHYHHDNVYNDHNNYRYHNDHYNIHKSVRSGKSMLESGWNVLGIAFDNDADCTS